MTVPLRARIVPPYHHIAVLSTPDSLRLMCTPWSTRSEGVCEFCTVGSLLCMNAAGYVRSCRAGGKRFEQWTGSTRL